MVRRLGAAAVAAILATTGAVRADQATLREARRVVEEDVRYDRAQELLVTALHQGDNGPDDLAAIYELAGVAAVVLGQREVGEQYFRRLLALRPGARLPAHTAPKILEPFTAAQAHMAAVGSLRVAVRASAASELVVEVAADPLGMVAGATVGYRGGDGETGSVRGEMPAPIAVTLPGGATATSVEIIDEYGNRLHELPPPPVPARRDDGDGRLDRDGRLDPPPPGEPAPSLFVRWPTWAIAAGVSGAVGLGFAIDGKRSRDRLEQILANPEDHFFGEAEAARTRWKRDTTIANIAFVTSGVLAVGAVTVAFVMRDRGADRNAAIVPWVGEGAGVAVVGVLP
jgi:hypothetical protein